jgi:4-diphosphocytidyl-2-C-methyl-D-erythritol kinase
MLCENSYTRVTLALDIVRKLTEGEFAGYHELNIVKHQISLCDEITVEPASAMSIRCDNPMVPLDSRNICWKVAEEIRHRFQISDNVRIGIRKRIPVQGGLAGGSANAATVISLLNQLWKLNLDLGQLRDVGRTAGMDVPFYFTGGTAFDTEATGILEPIATGLRFDFVLYLPSFGVSTSAAYGQIDYGAIARRTGLTRKMQVDLQSNDSEAVIKAMHNDFELSVFKHYPALQAMKAELLEAGCLNAVMSGSGSTLIGVARDTEHGEYVRKRLTGRSLLVSSKMS